jgi:hypothetical protein
VTEQGDEEGNGGVEVGAQFNIIYKYNQFKLSNSEGYFQKGKKKLYTSIKKLKRIN